MSAHMLAVGRDDFSPSRRACPHCGCMEPRISWTHEGCDYHEAEVTCPQCGESEFWVIVGAPEWAFPALANSWGVEADA